MTQKKILAVASIGGHWVQLLRIARPLEKRYEVVYMSTHPKCKSMVGTCRFHTIKRQLTDKRIFSQTKVKENKVSGVFSNSSLKNSHA